MRQLVIKHHYNGDPIRTIAKIVDLPRSTVYSIILKWNATDSVNNLIERGLKRLTSIRIDRIIHRIIMSNPRNSASNVAMDLKNNYQTSITPQTIRNRMHEIGYRGCIARRKPFVKKSNRYKRVLWAREHLSKPRVLAFSFVVR